MKRAALDILGLTLAIFVGLWVGQHYPRIVQRYAWMFWPIGWVVGNP